MKKVKVNKSDTGRWVSVKWDCVGRKDCLLVEVDLDNDYGKVYEPHEKDGLVKIDLNQIVEKREYINAA